METLSVDLHTLLFSWLDHNSVLSLRATCRVFRDLVDAWIPFWEKLAQGLRWFTLIPRKDGTIECRGIHNERLLLRKVWKDPWPVPERNQVVLTWSALLVKAMPAPGEKRDTLWREIRTQLLEHLKTKFALWNAYLLKKQWYVREDELAASKRKKRRLKRQKQHWKARKKGIEQYLEAMSTEIDLLSKDIELKQDMYVAIETEMAQAFLNVDMEIPARKRKKL